MSRTIVGFFSSIKLAIILLIALAVLSAAGTLNIIPQGLDPQFYRDNLGFWGDIVIALGLDDFFKSPLVRFLYLLFMVNLLLCGISRSIAGMRDFAGNGKPRLEVFCPSEEVAVKALAEGGFKARPKGASSIVKNRLSFLGFPLVHIAPLVIMAGAFIGTQFGFIGTQLVSVGDVVSSFYNWDSDKDVELPFAIHVLDRETIRYPGKLKVSPLFKDGGMGDSLVIELNENFTIPTTLYEGMVESYNVETTDMVYYLYSKGERHGPFSMGKEEGAPIRLRPDAYKGFQVKQVIAHADFYYEARQKFKKVDISVNSPLDYDDYRIYLTAWGEDDEGVPYVGFQVTRDPGELLVWIGSLFFTVGIFLLLYGDGGWARYEEGVLKIKAKRRSCEAVKKYLEEVEKG